MAVQNLCRAPGDPRGRTAFRRCRLLGLETETADQTSSTQFLGSCRDGPGFVFSDFKDAGGKGDDIEED